MIQIQHCVIQFWAEDAEKATEPEQEQVDEATKEEISEKSKESMPLCSGRVPVSGRAGRLRGRIARRGAPRSAGLRGALTDGETSGLPRPRGDPRRGNAGHGGRSRSQHGLVRVDDLG